MSNDNANPFLNNTTSNDTANNPFMNTVNTDSHNSSPTQTLTVTTYKPSTLDTMNSTSRELQPILTDVLLVCCMCLVLSAAFYFIKRSFRK